MEERKKTPSEKRKQSEEAHFKEDEEETEADRRSEEVYKEANLEITERRPYTHARVLFVYLPICLGLFVFLSVL